MQTSVVVAVAAVYIGFLFAVAWWGDRRAPTLAGGGARAAIFYALTLAVYNTSWSFYGSVGRAAGNGWAFLPIYLGPTLALIFAQPLLVKIITIAKAQNATSIADFIAARYGKSQSLAALLTVMSMIAMLPYIGLQLKAVAVSYDVLTSVRPGPAWEPAWDPTWTGPAFDTAHNLPFWRDTAFGVAALMAVFTILFGVRHIHARERHRGLMLAIAFESLVKLAAFVAVGLFITYGMFDGFGDLYARGAANPVTERLLVPDFTQPTWASNIVIATISFFCLPHIFHVQVVENENLSAAKRAAFLYPVYLAILSAFMLPIAVAGLTAFAGQGVNPDTFVITLPIAAHAETFSLIAFLGGLSAATGMVIVATVSLSTMICNDVAAPVLLMREKAGVGDMSRRLLLIRRIAVVLVLLLAYVTYRLVDRGYPLTVVGLMSFVAVAQFGPAFFGGLYWRAANRSGALAGLGAGFVVWVYALLAPATAGFLDLPTQWLTDGPWGIAALRPHALFGMEGPDPISHATLWSLAANILCFIAVSLLTRTDAVDRVQAEAFVDTPGSAGGGFRQAPTSLDELRRLAVRFLGAEPGRSAFDAYLTARGLRPEGDQRGDLGPADFDAIRYTENLLAGAVGAASARVVMAAALQNRNLSRRDAMAMLDEASTALQFNRSLLQASLESVRQGICVVDGDFNITAWNGRFLELLDLPGDLVRVGLPLKDVIRFNVDRGEYAADDIKALIVNRDIAIQQWPYTYERRRPDGLVLEISFNRMPGGGFVATYADITERHRAAQALREANETLEGRVRERTAALQLAKGEAEQANAAKTRFLAAASHDLMQPLNAARLFVAALEETLRDDPGAAGNEGRRLARNAGDSLRSAEQLLAGLLDISSLDSGAVKADVRDFPVGPLLARLGVEFEALARARGLTLRVVACNAAVRSDPQLLRRVLQNFLSNAVRYAPRRGRAGGRVLLGCRRDGDQLRLEVWDDGPGIPQDQQTAVFEEFRRLRRSGEPMVEQGLGLGLAIVDRIARMLGHPVRLRSTVGRGSCFSVSVPSAPTRSTPEQAAAAAPPEAVAAGLSVLCIDNEEPILEAMRALLTRWGCRVVTACDEAQALERLDGAVPDVACVDYHIGEDDDGLTVLARLRRRWGADVRGLLLTADRTPEVKAQAAAAGCQIIYKPVKPASLRRFLNGASLATETNGEGRE